MIYHCKWERREKKKKKKKKKADLFYFFIYFNVGHYTLSTKYQSVFPIFPAQLCTQRLKIAQDCFELGSRNLCGCMSI